MADNYLERKMEELRNRGNKTGSHHSIRKNTDAQKGILQLKFPPRRVLIAVGNGLEAEKALEIAGIYRHHGCRTALIGENLRNMINGKGIEGQHRLLETSDIPTEFGSLYKAWLGLDILIASEWDLKEKIEDTWKKERDRLPAATSYIPRTLTIIRGQVHTRLHGDEPAVELPRQLLLASL